MASWKGRLLNKAGKLCLAKSVVSSLPIYIMQTHIVPNSVCHKIDPITRKFIWGQDGGQRSWNLVNWEVLTSPRKHGGFGVRDAKITNLALLGKLIWSLIHDRGKLWVQELSHKYLGQNSLWQATCNNNVSITWKGIVKAAEAFRDGYEMKFHSGNLSLWYSDWMGEGPSVKQTTICPYI